MGFHQGADEVSAATTRFPNRCPTTVVSTKALSVSPLPYTLTWTIDHVHVSRNQEILEVIRVVKNTGCGGRLQGKFEKFDRTDDCDIVPYLF